MCGIAGFVGQGDDQTLSLMMGAIAHRGPDSSGSFRSPELGAFLGHRRLSIVDIEGGSQPMCNEDGLIQVVFNGEIYNHRELRNELVARGHVFRTDHSDTEVLVHGYEEWGNGLPQRLNGMFAFAVLDISQRRLVLARDRFGEKPLYYCHQAGVTAFASELKALLRHPGIGHEISKSAMLKFFAFGFIPSPESIIGSIAKLPPGHLLSLDLQTRCAKVDAYWQFQVVPDTVVSKMPRTELEDQLRYLVTQAVTRRLMSDVPLGVFLSGGIDSTIVLSAMAEHIPSRDIHAFSIGFNEPSFDESSYAGLVAQHYGINHHTEYLDLNKARALVEPVLDALDEPLGDPSILPTFLLAQFARRHVKVALGGDGADELFAGYDPFRALMPARLYSRIVPPWMHRMARYALEVLPPSQRNMSLEFRLKRSLRGLSYPAELWNPVWLGPLDPDALSHLFGEPIKPDDVYNDATLVWKLSKSKDMVDRTLEFYSRLYLPDDILVKTDRASMMVSLEARAPFLDNDLVDFARRLPASYKLDGQTTKALLKSAFRGRIPEAVISRPKKGFGIPLGAWLREWDDISFLDSLPFIDHGWLKARWEEHRSGTADHRQLLWCALSMHRFISSINVSAI